MCSGSRVLMCELPSLPQSSACWCLLWWIQHSGDRSGGSRHSGWFSTPSGLWPAWIMGDPVSKQQQQKTLPPLTHIVVRKLFFYSICMDIFPGCVCAPHLCLVPEARTSSHSLELVNGCQWNHYMGAGNSTCKSKKCAELPSHLSTLEIF